jgi:ADP-heptose:LPS heptosyltransferase
MRILILQTTRMGDVLQTTPLIHVVREKYPKGHISLMVRKMGAAIAERNPDIDEIIVYDEDELYRHLDSGDSDRLLQAYELAEERIASLRAQDYDIVLNATHSLGSAMIAKLAQIPEVHGASLSEDWQFILRGSWTNYFFTSVFSREHNDLNLCDISRNIIPDAHPSPELRFALTDEDREFARTLLAEAGIAPDDLAVCFQLGASEENKRWSVERFAALARILIEDCQARIILVGIAEEQPLGNRFEELLPDVALHLFGKTTIPQVAAVLAQSSMLVTNDTGTMHIAAAVKCPITLVSVGNVHYRETGPYGVGHCAIEARKEDLGRSDFVPEVGKDRERIAAAQVLTAIQYTKQHGGDAQPQLLEDEPALADVDIYMTRFAPDGFLQFYPAIRRPQESRDFLRIAYRAMWLSHLSETDNSEQELTGLDHMFRHFDGPYDGTIDHWAATYGQQFQGLVEMSERGINTTESLLMVLDNKGSIDEAKKLVSELMALDEEGRVYGEVNTACRPLILMARFERDNLEGADVMILASTTLNIYRSCAARAELMSKKLRLLQERWTACMSPKNKGR